MSDKPIAYEDGERVCYRASALGGCLVSLAAARQGLEAKPIPPDAPILRTFADGHAAEDQFVTIFPSAIDNRQMEVTLPITSRLYVVGHVDGLHGDRLAEIKSQSDDEYENWTPAHWSNHPLWIKYAWQISCYMLALDREAAVFRVRRSNVEDFQIQVVERPFFSIDDIRGRVLDVEELARETTLLCSRADYPCPYPYLHVEGEMVTDKALLDAIEDYVKAGDDEKYAKEIKGLAREVFVGMFDKHGDKIVTPNGYKLSRSVYDKEGYWVKPREGEVRITVTPPKES